MGSIPPLPLRVSDTSVPLFCRTEKGENNVGQLCGKKRRDGVADLMILLGLVSLEEVIVRKGLQPRCFAHGQRATLCNIIVDEMMPIFCNMAGDCRWWTISQLNLEAIGKGLMSLVAIFSILLSENNMHINKIHSASSIAIAPAVIPQVVAMVRSVIMEIIPAINTEDKNALCSLY